MHDAVRRDLGLKLVKEERPEPVLAIDHIDEHPTPNGAGLWEDNLPSGPWEHVRPAILKGNDS